MPTERTPPEVLVYTLPYCSGCEQVKTYLKDKQIAFTLRDAQADPQAQQELLALGALSAPTIKIGSTVIFGFNPRKIDKALAANAPANPQST
jgi:glutaredoxin